MSDLDLDELRVSHDETQRAALEIADRLADMTVNGPFDTASTAFRHGLAANLTVLLKRERSLRRAIKAEVAG